MRLLATSVAIIVAGLAVTRLASTSEIQPIAIAGDDMNPFFSESERPHGLPAFDQITDEHYLPAFERGMSEQLAEVDAIAHRSESPTFENTLVALERSGRLLDRVASTFFILSGAHTNDAMNDVRAEIAPRLAAHTDSIQLNQALFGKVKTLFEQRDALDLNAESRRLLEEYHTDFVRAGAELSAVDRERMQEINAELAGLQTTFTQNVLDEVNDAVIVVDSRTELAGMSDGQIAAAGAAARARDLDDRYVIPLLNTSGHPVLATLEHRGLRERIMQASLARGSQGGAYDNRATITAMARLRAERAALLGYPTHAAYVLEQQTARTVEAVNQRLASLTPAAVANARREASDLQGVARDTGDEIDIAAWDWSYYSEKLRADRYDFDASELRPYLEIDNVVTNGVFFCRQSAVRCDV